MPLFKQTGNADANSTVVSNAKTSVWLIEAGLKGYLSGDFTLDGQVDNRDKNDIWLPNFGVTYVVP